MGHRPMKAKADARYEATQLFHERIHLPIRWAGQKNGKQDMCNAGWQERIAVKASAESKILRKSPASRL